MRWSQNRHRGSELNIAKWSKIDLFGVRAEGKILSLALGRAAEHHLGEEKSGK
jgi:hypothetical protein